MCNVESCERPSIAKGLCRMHYKRQYRGGPIGPAAPLRGGPRPLCRVEGCGRPVRYRGWCPKHHSRWKRHGDPLAVKGTERGTVRVESVEFNGIVFRRYPDARQASHRRYFKPSGWFIAHGVQALHQEIWKAENGPIPKGHEIHHRSKDYSDNSIGNLELVTSEKHDAAHSAERSKRSRSAQQRAHLERIRPLASDWHRSEEGREWHRKHVKDSLWKK